MGEQTNVIIGGIFGIVQIAILVLSIMICVYANNAYSQSDISMAGLEQISTNWER